MYLHNKYTTWYNNIITRAKSRHLDTYTENHHIIPKSLGGDNSKDNIVALTAREHFVCHLLLTRMTTGDARNKMLSAVFYLTGRGKAKRNNVIKKSRLYQKLKEDFSKYNSKLHKGRKHAPRSKETRRRLSKSKSGKLNPNYKHDYTTPWGKFSSPNDAADACVDYITGACIRNYCTTKNDMPISYLSVCRSKGWLKEEHIGKTPAELGFSV